MIACHLLINLKSGKKSLNGKTCGLGQDYAPRFAPLEIIFRKYASTYIPGLPVISIRSLYLQLKIRQKMPLLFVVTSCSVRTSCTSTKILIPFISFSNSDLILKCLV